MPYPKGHKIKVRNKIVESAAQAFRTNGIHDVSVPFIMKGAGLTHGGFYSHFDNKEQLVAEACGMPSAIPSHFCRRSLTRKSRTPKSMLSLIII